jgi:hypothetical protein
VTSKLAGSLKKRALDAIDAWTLLSLTNLFLQEQAQNVGSLREKVGGLLPRSQKCGHQAGQRSGHHHPHLQRGGNALIFCGERRHVAPAAILDLFSDGPPVKACFWWFETLRPCFEQARNIRGLHAMWRRFLPWHVPMFMTVTTGGTCLVIASLTICSGWTFSMP